MSTKYTKEVLQDAVDNSVSIAGVLRYLGLKQAGGTQAHIGRKIKELDINTEHFTGQGHNLGKVDSKRKVAADILVVLPAGSNRPKRAQLLRAMTESGIEYRCRCGVGSEWQGTPITLDIDHIDGNWLNNGLENLRFLCPNCHSQEANSNMPHKYRQA